VKEFWVYTGMRVALFLGTLAIVAGVWAATGSDVDAFLAVVIAFLISGVGSYFLLDRQREAFARRVQTRADRASAKLEEMRSKEDDD